MICMAVSFSGAVKVGVRHQRQIACALDCRRQLTLIAGLGAGNARRHDLAVLGDEVLQQFDILVIDLFDLLGAEAAKLAALEKAAALLVVLALVLETTLRFESHSGFLPKIPSYSHVAPG